MLAKVVADLMIAAEGNLPTSTLHEFDKTFKLRTIKSGPGNLRFFGINVEHREDNSITTNADDKLESFIKI